MTQIKSDDFIILNDEEKNNILQVLNQKLGDQSYDFDDCTIRSALIPFYHGYEYLDIVDTASHPARKHCVLHSEIDGDMRIIEHTNAYIYQLNKEIPLMLDYDNVFDYARFFFAHVVGAHGRFHITESIDDIRWKEQPAPNAYEVISKMIQPLAILAEHKDGSYDLMANFMFKTGLLKAQLHVNQDGIVTMSNEEMMVEDIPAYDDVVGY